MQWRGKDETDFTKGLEFTYDGVNRLKNAVKPQTATYTYVDTESGINYDLNGNILALNRAGASVDNLTYSYLGNRLSAINDGSGNNTGVKSGPSSYAYDANGNMTSDGNRNATLAYNHLNLPKTVVVGGKTLTYDYDAAGNKHKYVADTLTLKYAGAFEYRQVGAANNFPRLSISEGQAVFRKDSLRFDYYLKDHLGNVRVVFDEKGNILQKSDYYPFGLAISRDGSLPQNARNGVNRYLYNEKELQLGTGYLDYGSRMYMPEIGRWGVVDPMAEKYHDLSSYNYVTNNPIKFIDPEGFDIWIGYGDGQRARYENGKLYNEDGSRYKGKDSFVSKVLSTLNTIGGSEIGNKVLGELTSSKNDFSFSSKTTEGTGENDIRLEFQRGVNGGGEILAGNLMNPKVTEGGAVESTAHELYHGYQYEKGELGKAGNSSNIEVGAYLFGKAVSFNTIGTQPFIGNNTASGKLYSNSMNNLFSSDRFNYNLYNTAVNNFVRGSSSSNTRAYKTLIPRQNDRNPIIKGLFPLRFR